MTDWNLLPEDIEKKSFAIIDEEASGHGWPEPTWRIIRRMIHTSADFEYVTSVRMHDRAIESGLAAIHRGKAILTDTRMAQAGISDRRLAPFGVKVDCLIDHPEVIRRAKAHGTTRAVAAVDLSLESESPLDGPPGIYVVGNAPTALFRLLELVQTGQAAPELIVGLPVGFVNAAEAKAALLDGRTPYLTNIGRKGGSNVAASVINALAVLAAEAGPENVSV